MNPGLWEKKAEPFRECAAAGLTIAETARALNMTPVTVRTYAKRFDILFTDYHSRRQNDVKAMLYDLAGGGTSAEQAAEKLGVSKAAVYRMAARNGVIFKRPGKQYEADARTLAMAEMYRNGSTLEQIGAQYGVTRERVRQLLTKFLGMSAKDGGKTKMTERRRAKKAARKDAESLARWGCTYSQYVELINHGKAMVAQGAKRERTPTGAFISQRRNAKSRGIDWNLSLWEWWTIWQESGRWEERGRGHGYMMCRHGDIGPYEVGNVFIQTGSHNSKVQPNNPYRRSHPDFERVMVQKYGDGRTDRGCLEEGCGHPHYARGFCQAHYNHHRYLTKKNAEQSWSPWSVRQEFRA